MKKPSVHFPALLLMLPCVWELGGGLLILQGVQPLLLNLCLLPVTLHSNAVRLFVYPFREQWLRVSCLWESIKRLTRFFLLPGPWRARSGYFYCDAVCSSEFCLGSRSENWVTSPKGGVWEGLGQDCTSHPFCSVTVKLAGQMFAGVKVRWNMIDMVPVCTLNKW